MIIDHYHEYSLWWWYTHNYSVVQYNYYDAVISTITYMNILGHHYRIRCRCVNYWRWRYIYTSSVCMHTYIHVYIIYIEYIYIYIHLFIYIMRVHLNCKRAWVIHCKSRCLKCAQEITRGHSPKFIYHRFEFERTDVFNFGHGVEAYWPVKKQLP